MIKMNKKNNKQDSQRQPKPNPALTALNVLVGTWDLEGRDLTTDGEIRGRSTFEWLEGGFFLFHHFNVDYAGRKITGIEFIGYNEKSGYLTTHVFSNLGPDTSEFTWELDEDMVTIWVGAVGSPDHYTGKFNEDRTTLQGEWKWPGGGYEATLTKIP